jgi:hypothetical protein
MGLELYRNWSTGLPKTPTEMPIRPDRLKGWEDLEKN